MGARRFYHFLYHLHRAVTPLRSRKGRNFPVWHFLPTIGVLRMAAYHPIGLFG